MLQYFKPAGRIIAFFIAYLIVFILLKPVFMAVHISLMGDITLGDWLKVIYHGLPMDCSMAGYLTLLPSLMTAVGIWFPESKAISVITRSYIALTAILIGFISVIDLNLYGYWNFRIDTTPFFYFFSSPTSAFASTGTGMIILGFVLSIILSALIYLFVAWLVFRFPKSLHVKRRILSTIITLFLTVALILPIRGSLTVSTMNLSRSYFSTNQRLNHAAINPVFSLMYSATHQNDFSSQFSYFETYKADEIFRDLSSKRFLSQPDTITPLLSSANPDIYVIILESFSAHLLPSLGGEPIATGLDSIASNALLFSNFYASGARTDRAIPAILSGFPAQPTTSLMKFAKKIEHTPSWSKALSDQAGYELSYYYGGDANFTNMLAYLISSGFTNIVSDKDFPIMQRTSKWGVHDDIVFDRAWSEIIADSASTTPKLRVIQTSSSHEPFIVPFNDPRFPDNDRKNAFAYTDRSLTQFIDSLSASPLWQKSIVIITPDHYGVYPQNLDNPLDRHHIPLILTGGALNRQPAVISTPADQTVIASTILTALGLDSSAFTFSRNVFDNSRLQYAFFSEPGMAAFVSATDTVAINLDNDKPLILSGENPDAATDRCKAILQTVYNTIDHL